MVNDMNNDQQVEKANESHTRSESWDPQIAGPNVASPRVSVLDLCKGPKHQRHVLGPSQCTCVQAAILGPTWTQQELQMLQSVL